MYEELDVIMETAQHHLHDMGDIISPPTFRLLHYPRRLKSHPEGEKTLISPMSFSVKYSSHQ